MNLHHHLTNSCKSTRVPSALDIPYSSCLKKSKATLHEEDDDGDDNKEKLIALSLQNLYFLQPKAEL